MGAFSHETNSFSPWSTRLDDFGPPNGGMLRGRAAMAERLASDCPVAGFVAEVERSGYEAIPVLDAHAAPSGTIQSDAYRAISVELLEALISTEQVSAFLLSLHGAAAADGCLDPEGDLVTRLRAERPDCPIGVVLEHHAGLSDALVRASDVIVGFKTEPHVDTAACGEKAARVVGRILRGEVERIDRCFIRLPVLLPIENLRTTEGPLREVSCGSRG